MLTIKIYLKESGQVADMKKDFPVYRGQFNNILLNVFVPTSLLAPYFQEVADGSVVSPYVAGTAVKIAMRTIERNGSYMMSNDHYLRYIKTLAKDGVSYALFERKMPQEFTNYAGQGVNAPTLIINAVNVQYGEISSATVVSSNAALTVTTDITTVKAKLPAVSAVYEFIYNAAMGSWTIDGKACVLSDYGVTVTGVPADQNVITLTIVASEPAVQRVLTSQTVNIDVQPSSSLDNDVPKTADEWADTQATINSLTQQINALINAVAQRQTIDDEELKTTAKRIVPAINEVSSGVDENTLDISDLKTAVQGLEENISTGENYIGTMSGASLPTDSQLTAFVAANTDPSRAPKAGDMILFEQIIEGATDKAFKYIWKAETKTWGSYEIPPIEKASNGTAGLVAGTYLVEGLNYPVVVDIVGGEVHNIYIKDGENFISLDTFFFGQRQNWANLVSGAIIVGKAEKAVADEDGNNIKSTYQTKTAGATKQDIVNYSLPKAFNNVFYLTDNGYSTEIPTAPTTIAVNVSSVGYSTLFEKSISFDTDTDIQLGSKNAFSNVFYASATNPENVVFHLTTSATQGDVTTIVAITDVPIEVSEGGTRVEFRDVMTELGDKVLSLGNGDKITQKLEVFREVSAETTFTVYSILPQPSVFYLYTGAVSVTGATVVQETGDSQANVMSQNAVTQELEKRALKGRAVDFPFGNSSITYDTTDGLHIVGTMRVYTAEDKSSYYDIENVDVEIPIIAGDNTVSMDANTTNTQLLIKALKGVSSVLLTSTGALEFTLSDGTKITTDPLGGTIDADTLNGLLSGGNGIVIAKNARGDKVEAKLSNHITLGFLAITGSLTINTFGGNRPTFITLNDDGISTRYGNAISINIVEDGIKYADSSHGPTVTYNFLREDTVKTLFGNQSIYGSGNIDLYRHNVTIRAIGSSFQFEAISSSNLEIDSLTDLTTVFGDNFKFTASGTCQGNMVVCVQKDRFDYWYLEEHDITAWGIASKTYAELASNGNFTISDTVTTV